VHSGIVKRVESVESGFSSLSVASQDFLHYCVGRVPFLGFELINYVGF